MVLCINEDGDTFLFGQITYLGQGFVDLFAWWGSSSELLEYLQTSSG